MADPMTCPKCGQPHDPKRCKAHRKTDGIQCGCHPIQGGDVCNKHGGSAGQVRKAATRRVVEKRALAELAAFGVPIEVDPRDAALQEVWRSAGRVAYYEQRVKEIEAADRDALVWGVTEEAEIRASEFGGTNTKREAKPNIWLELEFRERKHFRDAYKTAHDMGVEDRQNDLAELFGKQMFALMSAAFDALQLTPEQQALIPAAMSLTVSHLSVGK